MNANYLIFNHRLRPGDFKITFAERVDLGLGGDDLGPKTARRGHPPVADSCLAGISLL